MAASQRAFTALLLGAALLAAGGLQGAAAHTVQHHRTPLRRLEEVAARSAAHFAAAVQPRPTDGSAGSASSPASSHHHPHCATTTAAPAPVVRSEQLARSHWLAAAAEAAAGGAAGGRRLTGGELPVVDIPSCGLTECDNPAVLAAYRDLPTTPVRTIQYRVINLGLDDGSHRTLTAEQISQQHDTLNAAYAGTGIQFELTELLVNTSFVRLRTIFVDCNPADVGNGVCNAECAHQMTGNDGGDCDAEQLPCAAALIGDGTCQLQCNKAYHNYDGGDCCDAGVTATEHTCFDPASAQRAYVSAEEFKGMLNIANDDYMNLYFAFWTNRNVLGYATFPWETHYAGPFGGIVLNPTWYGSRTDGDVVVSEGDTLVHESGHALGLWHTFHGVSELDCAHPCFEWQAGADVGDLIADTPPTSINFDCGDPDGQTCGVSWTGTPFTNYMGYGDDVCIDNFTPLQAARMRCYVDRTYAAWTRTTDTPTAVPLAPRVYDAADGSLSLSWPRPLFTARGESTSSLSCEQCSDANGLRMWAAQAAASAGADVAATTGSPCTAALQAAGRPNAPTCRYSCEAWQPAAGSDAPYSLTVTFEQQVTPSELHVYIPAYTAAAGGNATTLDSVVLLLADTSEVPLPAVTLPGCEEMPLVIPLAHLTLAAFLSGVRITTSDAGMAIDAVLHVSADSVQPCNGCTPTRYELERTPAFDGGASTVTIASGQSFTDGTVDAGSSYSYRVQHGRRVEPAADRRTARRLLRRRHAAGGQRGVRRRQPGGRRRLRRRLQRGRGRLEVRGRRRQRRRRRRRQPLLPVLRRRHLRRRRRLRLPPGLRLHAGGRARPVRRRRQRQLGQRRLLRRGGRRRPAERRRLLRLLVRRLVADAGGRQQPLAAADAGAGGRAAQRARVGDAERGAAADGGGRRRRRQRDRAGQRRAGGQLPAAGGHPAGVRQRAVAAAGGGRQAVRRRAGGQHRRRARPLVRRPAAPVLRRRQLLGRVRLRLLAGGGADDDQHDRRLRCAVRRPGHAARRVGRLRVRRLRADARAAGAADVAAAGGRLRQRLRVARAGGAARADSGRLLRQPVRLLARQRAAADGRRLRDDAGAGDGRLRGGGGRLPVALRRQREPHGDERRLLLRRRPAGAAAALAVRLLRRLRRRAGGHGRLLHQQQPVRRPAGGARRGGGRLCCAVQRVRRGGGGAADGLRAGRPAAAGRLPRHLHAGVRRRDRQPAGLLRRHALLGDAEQGRHGALRGLPHAVPRAAAAVHGRLPGVGRRRGRRRRLRLCGRRRLRQLHGRLPAVLLPAGGAVPQQLAAGGARGGADGGRRCRLPAGRRRRRLAAGQLERLHAAVRRRLAHAQRALRARAHRQRSQQLPRPAAQQQRGLQPAALRGADVARRAVDDDVQRRLRRRRAVLPLPLPQQQHAADGGGRLLGRAAAGRRRRRRRRLRDAGVRRVPVGRRRLVGLRRLLHRLARAAGLLRAARRRRPAGRPPRQLLPAAAPAVAPAVRLWLPALPLAARRLGRVQRDLRPRRAAPRRPLQGRAGPHAVAVLLHRGAAGARAAVPAGGLRQVPLGRDALVGLLRLLRRRQPDAHRALR
eukprot:PLAT3361.17.p1 GENE.PLAT3361.17~~PLAT3361.17.p1  ORF type:complete len:1601 (+),score=578.33 PLAT3361.17:47-4804(+)